MLVFFNSILGFELLFCIFRFTLFAFHFTLIPRSLLSTAP